MERMTYSIIFKTTTKTLSSSSLRQFENLEIHYINFCLEYSSIYVALNWIGRVHEMNQI